MAQGHKLDGAATCSDSGWYVFERGDNAKKVDHDYIMGIASQYIHGPLDGVDLTEILELYNRNVLNLS